MYVRRKTSPGRADYYQLVESSRVDGKPRQRVVLHLGQHATADDALKKWPREITRLRRRGDTRAADALKIKLGVLKAVLPKKLWRVSKELENLEGFRWIRARLEGCDWSECEGIVVGRGKHTHGGVRRPTRVDPRKTTDDPLAGLYDRPPKKGGCLIVVRLAKDTRYPDKLVAHRGLSIQDEVSVQDESEALVWLLAGAAINYLSQTGQAFGATASELLEEFRSSRQLPTPTVS